MNATVNALLVIMVTNATLVSISSGVWKAYSRGGQTVAGEPHAALRTFVCGSFVLLRLNLLGQRKLPIVFPLSGMLCLWP